MDTTSETTISEKLFEDDNIIRKSLKEEKKNWNCFDFNAHPGHNLCVNLQQPCQSIIRPAEMGFISRSNRRVKEIWKSNTSSNHLKKCIIQVFSELEDSELRYLDSPSLLIRTNTKHCSCFHGNQLSSSLTIELTSFYGWLDIIDIQIFEDPLQSTPDQESCVAYITVASTGCIPLKIPCAPLLNLPLSLLPYPSVMQAKRLSFLASKLEASHAIDPQRIKQCTL